LGGFSLILTDKTYELSVSGKNQYFNLAKLRYLFEEKTVGNLAID